MAVIFETERLIARHWEPDRDASGAFAIYGDPEVQRFLGRQPQVVPSIAEMRERLTKLVLAYREKADRTGGWALEDKSSGDVIGCVLVKHLPDAEGMPTPDLEIGWHLKRSAWGHGYATEAGAGGLAYAFSVLQAPQVYAVVYKENTRSIAVAQRLGMTPLGPTDRYYGVMVELFEKKNPTRE